jgi:CheY-like chemotaxis protein
LSPNNRKTLVVCADRRTRIVSGLKERGWSVSLATSGQNAVNLARRINFDLIVLISTDSDMDITETLFNLRDIRERAQVVVLVTSEDHGVVSAELANVAHTSIVPISEFSGYIEGYSELTPKRFSR